MTTTDTENESRLRLRAACEEDAMVRALVDMARASDRDPLDPDILTRVVCALVARLGDAREMIVSAHAMDPRRHDTPPLPDIGRLRAMPTAHRPAGGVHDRPRVGAPRGASTRAGPFAVVRFDAVEGELQTDVVVHLRGMIGRGGDRREEARRLFEATRAACDGGRVHLLRDDARPVDASADECPSCGARAVRGVVARFVRHHCTMCATEWTVDTETGEVSS